MFRQGDVLLVPVDEFPNRLRIPVEADESGQIVVMEGEATGHAHALPAGQVNAFRTAGEMHLEVVEETTLTHEEHDPISIPPGAYRVVRQREYSPSLLPRPGRSPFSYVAD